MNFVHVNGDNTSTRVSPSGAVAANPLLSANPNEQLLVRALGESTMGTHLAGTAKQMTTRGLRNLDPEFEGALFRFFAAGELRVRCEWVFT